MKFLSEYRDADAVKVLIDHIKSIVTREWNIMEICGGQTHGLVKNGILAMLPKEVQMVHGPGCPVCVTPLHLIDDAIYLAEQADMILCSFGDMLRVPGSEKSLLQAKAEGADIKVVYSPLEVVKMAQQNPNLQYVFFAVGFETTAPANALAVIQAHALGLKNFSILVSHVLVPPAMKAILDDPDNVIDGFLAAGHVCTIMGTDEYRPIAQQYKIPITITGFEPVDLLQGIAMTVEQLEKGTNEVQNQYARVVAEEGNRIAQGTISRVFDTVERVWRGVGEIDQSGYALKADYSAFDAHQKFDIPKSTAEENPDCIAGEVLRGKAKPADCPNFGTKCTPENPLGAPMVSSEGACAAYYHFSLHALNTES